MSEFVVTEQVREKIQSASSLNHPEFMAIKAAISCPHSPSGYHEMQKKSTIAACQYCGKIL